MKRLLALLLLAAVAVTGCGGDDAAVTVNGHEAMSVDELQATLDELAGAEDMLTSVNGRGAGSDTLRSAYVGPTVVGNIVLTELLRQDLEEEGIEVTPQDITDGTTILTANFASPQDGSSQLTLEQVPDRLEAGLVDQYARLTALLRSLGGDPSDFIGQPPGTPVSPETQAALNELDERLVELRLAADVEIDPRWGRWVATDTGAAVEPPEGPIAVSDG